MKRSCKLCLLVLPLLASGAASTQFATAAQPAGETEVYLTPFSHLDLFWGGLREEDLARGCQIIAKAMRLANQSPQFRFLIEDDVMVANFLDSHKGSPEVEDL